MKTYASTDTSFAARYKMPPDIIQFLIISPLWVSVSRALIKNWKIVHTMNKKIIKNSWRNLYEYVFDFQSTGMNVHRQSDRYLIFYKKMSETVTWRYVGWCIWIRTSISKIREFFLFILWQECICREWFADDFLLIIFKWEENFEHTPWAATSSSYPASHRP